MADEISRDELAKTIKELKFYFDEVGTIDSTGEYVIHDIEPLKEKAKTDKIAQEILDLLNQHKDQTIDLYSTSSYVKCIINKFVASYGEIWNAFFGGAVIGYLEKKEWTKAAKLLIKAAAKAGVKAGGILVAGELALYAVQCGFA